MNLKVLSVCDNEILAIQGLDQCVLLEELLMEENRVGKMENLSALVSKRSCAKKSCAKRSCANETLCKSEVMTRVLSERSRLQERVLSECSLHRLY